MKIEVSPQANIQLSNLFSTAINTSLISDTDSTDNLGSTTIAWANLYVDTISSITGNALALTPVAGQSLTVNLSTTGDFIVNTDDLVVDTSAGYVGIGTASPSQPLTVSAGSAAAMALFTSTGAVTYITAAGSGGSAFFGVRTADTFIQHDTGAGVRIEVSGGALGTLYTGSLGVGTATLDTTLHVYRGDSAGASNAAASMTIEDDTEHYLQFLAPTTVASGIFVGDSGNSAQGFFRYRLSAHATANTWEWGTAGSTRLFYSANAFAFQETTTISSTTSPLVLTTAASGEVVVNDASADVNFRVESNNIAAAFGVDAGLDTVYVGTVSFNTNEFFTISRPAVTATAATDYYSLIVQPGGAVTIPTGATSNVATAVFVEPNITATGTITNASTIRIVNAPTEASNNYALWVDAGATRLDGTVQIGTLGAFAAGDLYVIVDASGNLHKSALGPLS